MYIMTIHYTKNKIHLVFLGVHCFMVGIDYEITFRTELEIRLYHFVNHE